MTKPAYSSWWRMARKRLTLRLRGFHRVAFAARMGWKPVLLDADPHRWWTYIPLDESKKVYEVWVR